MRVTNCAEPMNKSIHATARVCFQKKSTRLAANKATVSAYFERFIARFPDIQSLDGKEVVMYGVMEIYRGLPATQLIFNDQVQSWPVVPRSRT